MRWKSSAVSRCCGILTCLPAARQAEPFHQIGTNPVEMSVDVIIGISYERDSQPGQDFISFPIGICTFFPVVLRTIQFNDKQRFVAIKIRDIIVNNSLLIYFYRVITKKIIP